MNELSVGRIFGHTPAPHVAIHRAIQGAHGAAMSALRHSLDGLFAFLTNQGLVPPTRQVWLVEIPSDVGVDERGRLRVRRADFRDPDAYEDRFDELVAAGFPWINVSCCGLDGDRLVVVVETPRTAGRPPARTSVNYSGPARAALERGWDVREALAIT